MKITTTLIVHVEREDGTAATRSRVAIRRAGDNPRFEKHEVQQGILNAVEAFEELNNLGGTEIL